MCQRVFLFIYKHPIMSDREVYYCTRGHLDARRRSNLVTAWRLKQRFARSPRRRRF